MDDNPSILGAPISYVNDPAVIAHPDFRDELIKAAEAQHLWLPSNKR